MKNIHLNFAQIDYTCPFCKKNKSDINDKLLNRCNKNKSGFTKVKCECGKTYGFTYNMQGNAVAFEL